MSLELCWILVPVLRDSDGRPQEPWAWLQLERSLLLLGGGFTVSEVSGACLDSEGERVDDVSRRYEVALRWDQIPALRALAGRVCRSFDQQTLFLCDPAYGVSFVSPAKVGLLAEAIAAEVVS